MTPQEHLRTPDDGVADEATAERSEQSDSPTCPDCGVASVTDAERAEAHCPECGLVLEEDIVDRGPEWRAFDENQRDSKRRVGAPVTETLHDRGLSSVIGWQDKDAYGQSLSSRQRQKMQRLRTWDERFRTKSARERNLKQALVEVDRMASALGLTDAVRETAGVIYRRALEEDLLPGRSIEAMATASLYAAARQAGMPRSLDECAGVSRVERKEIARAYRYLAGELDLAVQPATPEQFLPRIVSDLDLPDGVEREARRLLEAGKRANVHSGKSPIGLAAAAIYAAAMLTNETITQHEIGEAADVSVVTIRNRYRELLEATEQ